MVLAADDAAKNVNNESSATKPIYEQLAISRTCAKVQNCIKSLFAAADLYCLPIQILYMTSNTS